MPATHLRSVLHDEARRRGHRAIDLPLERRSPRRTIMGDCVRATRGSLSVYYSWQLSCDVVRSMSLIGRYCCKSRKSNNPKNLAKVDLWASLRLRRSLAPLRRSVIDFG